MKKLWIALLALAFAAPAPAIIILAERGGGTTTITQFWTGARGENFLSGGSSGQTGYFYPFGEGVIGTSTNPNDEEVFGIVPIDGSFTRLRLYNDAANLTSGEDVTYTLVECSGGDIPGCSGSWTDTSVEVAVAGDGVSTSYDWTGTQTVTAGDVFSMRVVNGVSDWPDAGSGDSLNPVLVFEAANANETFVTVTVDRNTGATYYFPIAGPIPTITATVAQIVTPIPGNNFTLDGFSCALEVDATADRAFELCRYDDGTTTSGCNGTGEQLATCTVSNGTSQCSTSGNAVSLSTGDRLYYYYNHGFVAYAASCGTVFTTSADEFMTASCNAAHTLTTNSTEGGIAGQSSNVGGYVCNSTIDEQWCETALPVQATAKHMLIEAATAPAGAGESWTVSLNEGTTGAGTSNSAMSCSMGDGVTSCADADDVTIEADNTSLVQYTSSGTMTAGSYFCQSILWDTL